MEPKIETKPQIILAGLVEGARDVSELDIGGMWQRFTEIEPLIENRIEERGYELHIEAESVPEMHFCFVGTEVTEIGTMPIDAFVKVLSARKYAVFTHRVAEGYEKLYEHVKKWLKTSGFDSDNAFDFQLYDERFKSMDDPESLQDIYIPLKENPVTPED